MMLVPIEVWQPPFISEVRSPPSNRGSLLALLTAGHSIITFCWQDIECQILRPECAS
jgi:hypothetical protein